MQRTCFLIFLLILLTGQAALPQKGYLQRADLLALAEKGLLQTYNFQFEEARRYQKKLEEETPDHPVPPFMEALIIYWESFPLQPGTAEGERFIKLMELSVERAQSMIDSENLHMEGVFFDLFGRAFQAMFWADNGKAARVVPDLPIMYRRTTEGFDLKEQFVEFYFSTGLYNYYIEAYPEAHPVYRPLVSFMQPGNKNLGLSQLNHAIQHTVFLRVEAMLFMSLIQLNYENDLNSAAIYATKLYNEYPSNVYYQGLMVIILLHQHRYEKVRQELASIAHQDHPYSNMIVTLAEAFMNEKVNGDDQSSERGYRKTLERADSFGPIADMFQAIAYRGLARLHYRQGDTRDARRYERKAEDKTVYRFILEE